ncbi:MAG TPA: hypothetical protein GXX62_08015 [Alcaligenaceae bacterium]|nr:hypothetical protein [Alcaligenaceae bacterium]
MIRKKIHVFVCVFLLSLALLPAWNIYHNKSIENLYNTDVVQPLIGWLSYQAGISIKPNQTYLGKDGWFFLGDVYMNGVDKKRRLSKQDKEKIQTAIHNSELWERWFLSQGVKSYTIMLAPDKDSVYTEQLPDWVKNPATKPLDYFKQNSDENIYVVLLDTLKQATQTYPFPLYFKTDSHWNQLGAWIGFKTLMLQLQQKHSHLIFNSHDFENSLYRYGHKKGDLANFLHIADYLDDYFVSSHHTLSNPPTVEVVDYDKRSTKGLESIHFADSQINPILYKNPKALNQEKVLWIHDSFGSSVVPFMLEHFAEVVHIHITGATTEKIMALVQSFAPDFVITTVVERESRDRFYLEAPL